MARAKTPRNGNNRNKQVTAMPDLAIAPEGKKSSAAPDLESEVRRRAYQLYEQRGCTPGHEDEDWLVAEREVLARYQHQQSA